MANSINEVPLKIITSLFLCGVLFLSDCCLCQSVPGIYIFGDSVVDVGNNNHLPLSLLKANLPHNGIDFPTGKATGRFSNGKNIADFLAEKMGLPTAPPYLSLGSEIPITGVSLASGGAGLFNRTDDHFVRRMHLKTNARQAISMTQQVEYFSLVHDQLVKQLGLDGARAHLAKSLFFIVIGGNDLFAYFNNNSKVSKQYTPQQYVDLMASTFKELMKRLYGMDARKFAASGVGVIGCCPARRKQTTTNECNLEANEWSINYNNNLKLLLHDLKSELLEINYSYFDNYGVVNNIIQNPQSHGITEIKEACCGLGNMKAAIPCGPIATYCSNRRDHLFWDSVHPTETASSLYADLFYNGPQHVTFPINIEQLVKL